MAIYTIIVVSRSTAGWDTVTSAARIAQDQGSLRHLGTSALEKASDAREGASRD